MSSLKNSGAESLKHPLSGRAGSLSPNGEGAEFRNARNDLGLRILGAGDLLLSMREDANAGELLEIKISSEGSRPINVRLISKLKDLIESCPAVPERFINEVASLLTSQTARSLSASLQYHSKDLAEVTDTATGFSLKSLILDQEALNRVSRRIPGEKLLTYIDFNHMKIPNQFGLSKQVDEFIKELPALFAQSFEGKGEYEVVRLGGDEFLIICEDTEESLNAVNQAQKAISSLRDKMFPISDPKVSLAERVAALREEERMLSYEYWSKTHSGSVEEFGQWMIEEKSREGQRRMLENAAANPHTLQFVLSMLAIVRREDRNEHSATARLPILSASMASGKIGTELSPQNILALVSKLSEKVGERKRDPEVDLNTVFKFDPQHDFASTQQLSELAAYTERVLRSEQLCQELRASLNLRAQAETLKAIREIEAADPAVPSVMRFNQITKRRAADFLQLTHSKMYLAIEFDVLGYGAINNVLGADVADDVYRNVAAIAQKRLPASVSIRVGGGGLVMLIPDNENLDELGEAIEAARWEMNEYIDREINCDVRVLSEFREKQMVESFSRHEAISLDERERQLLEVLSEGVEEDSYAEGRVTILESNEASGSPKKVAVKDSSVRIQINPGDSSKDVISRLELFKRVRT